MKRKTPAFSAVLLLLATLMLMTLAFSACSKVDDLDDPLVEPYQYDDLSQFITMPDYKNMSLSQVDVDKSMLIELDGFYKNAELYVETYDRAVQLGDRVVLDFVGFIDGETFEGGNASDYSLLIGSGNFIDGFEDGLIGLNLSEAKDLNLTFPENYYEQFAGKDVVFSVTIKQILSPPTLTDELCSEYTNYRTKDEFLAKLKFDIVCNMAFLQLVSDSTLIKKPSEYDTMYNSIVAAFEKSAGETGMTLANYVSSFGGYYGEYGLYSGISLNSFYATINAYTEQSIKEDLVLYTIIRAENITTDSETFAEMRQVFMDENGFVDMNAMKEKLSDAQIVINVYYRCVIEIIYKNLTYI